MRIKNKLVESTQKIAKKVSPKFNYGRYDYVLWIIRKYISYAIEAAINGYSVKIYNIFPIARIELVWVPSEEMKKIRRKYFQVSNKMFGYMFFLSITGRYFKPELYDFLLELKIRRRIQEKLDSDAVYQFIKQ